MTPELFFENFGHLAEAPGGVAKLRELVLGLAVRGKLVEQDPEDEPASELLERIASKRRQLLEERKIRKPKALADLDEKELFAPPMLWRWARLGDLSFVITDGTHHTPTYVQRGVAFVSVKDISGGRLDFADVKYITEEEHQQINQRCNPERGDILICRIGTLGKPVVVDTDRPFSLFVSLGLIKFSKAELVPEYLRLALDSPTLHRQYQEIKAGGSHTNKLNLGDIPRLAIPVPPLPEQHRIVAKVDQLMALCDQLETRQEERNQTRIALNVASLHHLVTAPDDKAFKKSWERVRDGFDGLASRPEDVPALRQVILDLVVCGLISPNRFAGLSVKSTPVPQADPLPKGWSKCRLGEVLREPLRNGKSVRDLDGGFPVLRLSAFRSRSLNFEEAKSGDWTRAQAAPFLVEKGDFFVVRGNGALRLVGRGSLAQDCPREVAFPDLAIRVRPSELLLPSYLALAWDSTSIRQQIEAKARTTSGIYKVSQGDIKDVTLLLPTKREQRLLVAVVDKLIARCDALQTRLRRSRVDAERLLDSFADHLLAA